MEGKANLNQFEKKACIHVQITAIENVMLKLFIHKPNEKRKKNNKTVNI